MSWDAFQREVLAELGHVLYRADGRNQAGAPDAAGPVLPSTGDPPMLARVARAAGVAPEALPSAVREAAGALRGDPDAKRALWPALRTLRRAPPR